MSWLYRQAMRPCGLGWQAAATQVLRRSISFRLRSVAGSALRLDCRSVDAGKGLGRAPDLRWTRASIGQASSVDRSLAHRRRWRSRHGRGVKELVCIRSSSCLADTGARPDCDAGWPSGIASSQRNGMVLARSRLARSNRHADRVTHQSRRRVRPTRRPAIAVSKRLESQRRCLAAFLSRGRAVRFGADACIDRIRFATRRFRPVEELVGLVWRAPAPPSPVAWSPAPPLGSTADCPLLSGVG